MKVVDTGISNIMHGLINNACASKGFRLLLYSVNSFWIMLKEIPWKMKFNHQWHSLFLYLKPSVCNFFSSLWILTINKQTLASLMLPEPHTYASSVAMVSLPLMVWKTNIWENALESFSAGFCSPWIVPVEHSSTSALLAFENTVIYKTQSEGTLIYCLHCW